MNLLLRPGVYTFSQRLPLRQRPVVVDPRGIDDDEIVPIIVAIHKRRGTV